MDLGELRSAAPSAPCTRRGFLRLAGSATALAALSQLRVGVSAARAAGDAERFFDPTETEILTQLMERLVGAPAGAAPPVRETGAVARVDALCGGLDPSLSGPLPLALRLFEWGPLLFDFTFTRFTRLSDAEKDASLTSWMQSRLELRRLAFGAVRNLSFLGYYGDDAVWPAIGYEGPLL